MILHEIKNTYKKSEKFFSLRSSTIEARCTSVYIIIFFVFHLSFVKNPVVYRLSSWLRSGIWGGGHVLHELPKRCTEMMLIDAAHVS